MTIFLFGYFLLRFCIFWFLTHIFQFSFHICQFLKYYNVFFKKLTYKTQKKRQHVGYSDVAFNYILHVLVNYKTCIINSFSFSGPAKSLPHSGKPEGLIGKYTLQDVQDEQLQVLCSARNNVGQQQRPCVFTVYTQGILRKIF